MERIGFVGVGNMGEPIALNFLNKGCLLTVYDILPQKMKRLVSQGADWASTVREVSKGCQIICTSLPTPEAVKAVYLGDDGLLAGQNPALQLSTLVRMIRIQCLRFRKR